MPRHELTSLYPTESQKPDNPPGIDFEARQASLQELKRYYPPDAVSFGLPTRFDSFKGLADFLAGLDPKPEVNEATLRQFYTELPQSPPDQAFTRRATRLLRWLKRNENIMSTWKSCLYRPVSAVSQTSIRLRNEVKGNPHEGEEQDFIFGAVGSSGLHEFTIMPPKETNQLMQESLLEALVVRGFPISDFDREAKLVRRIKKTARSLLRKRGLDSPHAWSPNCQDFHQLANKGAEKIASAYGISLRPAADYKTCLMHKYNPQHDPYWQTAGLPLPGSFGRLRCPSHCAEGQSIFRTQIAEHIPLITGEPESYMLAIGNSVIELPNRSIKASELIYVVPRGSNFEFKRLIIDDQLTFMPFVPVYPYFSYLYDQLRQANIDVRDRSFVAVYLDDRGKRGNEELVVGSDLPAGLTTQTTYVVGGTELARFKWNTIYRIPYSRLSLDNLWTSTLPCTHCINTINQYGVDDLHMEEIDWKSLKGDDGLVLEWLMKNFPGQLSVAKHRF